MLFIEMIDLYFVILMHAVGEMKSILMVQQLVHTVTVVL
jgi:hypothetical protein